MLVCSDLACVVRRGADQVRRSSAPTAGRTDGYVVIGYATRKKIFFERRDVPQDEKNTDVTRCQFNLTLISILSDTKRQIWLTQGWT